MTDLETFYNLGRKDCLAEVLTEIRQKGVLRAIEGFIEELPDNPHAQYLKRYIIDKKNG